MIEISNKIKTPATLDFALATGRLEVIIEQLCEKISWCPDLLTMLLFDLTEAFNKFQRYILWAQQSRAKIISFRDRNLSTKHELGGRFECCPEELEEMSKLYGELYEAVMLNARFSVHLHQHKLFDSVAKELTDISNAIHKSMGELFDEVSFCYLIDFYEGETK